MRLVNASRPTGAKTFANLNLALVGLALAVFAWGLQYKLSLYDPPHALAREMPEAKLLTGERQASEAEQLLESHDAWSRSVRVLLAVVPSVLSSWAVSAGLAAPRIRNWELQAGRCAWKSLHSSLLNAHFFRPPPVLA